MHVKCDAIVADIPSRLHLNIAFFTRLLRTFMSFHQDHVWLNGLELESKTNQKRIKISFIAKNRDESKDANLNQNAIWISAAAKPKLDQILRIILLLG